VTSSGIIRYQLKTPYNDGIKQVIFEPLDFIAKLAALVLKPKMNLSSFHGEFAPNSKHRGEVTPSKRSRGSKDQEDEGKTPQRRHQVMTWAQRLKWVFNIDVSSCPKCGGETKVIAIIKDQADIDKILNHLQAKGALTPPPQWLSAARVPMPTWAILGDAEILEKGVSDKEFYIDFRMVHPLFGKTFGYSGVYTLAKA
jgi:hypothetical protein